MQNYTLPETARKFIRKNHVRGALLLLAFALLQAAIILSLCRNFSTSNQFVAAVEEVLLLLVYTRWWHRHVAALLWDKDYSGTVLDKEVIAESKRGDARAPAQPSGGADGRRGDLRGKPPSVGARVWRYGLPPLF